MLKKCVYLMLLKGFKSSINLMFILIVKGPFNVDFNKFKILSELIVYCEGLLRTLVYGF